VLELGLNNIESSSNINYLGINFVTGKHVKTDCEIDRRKFYAACNCIFSNCYNVSKLVQLQLQESYCLPLLTNSSAALDLDVKQSTQLNVCWNNVYRKIFKFNCWESVKCCINGLGRLDLLHMLAWNKLKFF
jgi:hypothetical protein